MNNENEHTRTVHLRIVESLDEQLKEVKANIKENVGVAMFKNQLVKIAVNEFLTDIKENKDIKTLLRKYQYI
jgi:ribosomal protein L10